MTIGSPFQTARDALAIAKAATAEQTKAIALLRETLAERDTLRARVAELERESSRQKDRADAWCREVVALLNETAPEDDKYIEADPKAWRAIQYAVRSQRGACARVAELEKSAHASSAQEGKLAHMLNQAQGRVALLEGLLWRARGWVYTDARPMESAEIRAKIDAALSSKETK